MTKTSMQDSDLFHKHKVLALETEKTGGWKTFACHPELVSASDITRSNIHYSKVN
jgi:hypothetical protein